METESNIDNPIVNDNNANQETMVNSQFQNIHLQYGDIIEIVSPANEEYHETTNYIHYIDNKQIRLTNVTSLKERQLNFTEDGLLTDESIQQIILISRSDEKGYASQHNLLPNTWINIFFNLY